MIICSKIGRPIPNSTANEMAIAAMSAQKKDSKTRIPSLLSNKKVNASNAVSSYYAIIDVKFTYIYPFGLSSTANIRHPLFPLLRMIRVAGFPNTGPGCNPVAILEVTCRRKRSMWFNCSQRSFCIQ